MHKKSKHCFGVKLPKFEFLEFLQVLEISESKIAAALKYALRYTNPRRNFIYLFFFYIR